MTAKKKPVEEVEPVSNEVEIPVPEATVSPVVTIGDGVCTIAFGDEEPHVLAVDQVHTLRRQLDAAFLELS